MKLVYIQWYDSQASQGGWRSTEDSICTKPLIIESIGWVLHEGKDSICIVSHRGGYVDNDDYKQANGDMTIPKCAIRKLKVIKL